MGSKERGVWEERDSKTRDVSKRESVKPLEGRTRMEKSRLLSSHPRLTSPTAHQHPRCRGRPAGVRGASEGHEGTIVRQLWGGRAGRNRLLQRAALCHYPVCRWTTQKTCEQLGGSKNKWTGGVASPGCLPLGTQPRGQTLGPKRKRTDVAGRWGAVHAHTHAHTRSDRAVKCTPPPARGCSDAGGRTPRRNPAYPPMSPETCEK